MSPARSRRDNAPGSGAADGVSVRRAAEPALEPHELRGLGLALFPELAKLPTSPLERWTLPSGWSVPTIWVKRDDLLGEGGTKLRKLQVELPRARAMGARVVTFGYLDSNHAPATARLGARLGVPVELQLLGDAEGNPKRASMLTSIAPTSLHRTTAGLVAATLLQCAKAWMSGRRLYLLPPGGTTAKSTAAVALGVAEVADQFQQAGAPIPVNWVVAVGTGGTFAGLQAGARALGLPVRIHGVAASSRLIGERLVARLANRVLRLLNLKARIHATQVNLRWEQLGRGHGFPTAGSETVFRELAANGHGIEPVFTAKALAWLRDNARPGESWLFWHTGNAEG